MSISDVLEGDLVDIVAGVGYFLALAYIMLAISHLCEEYFVASLSVVVEVFNIPPEVAGATLMAAGTSSPELFAAIIGLFFSKTSDTGISTVVGSVVFNTLMILGCSIWVSPTRSIQLTAGSFGRECVFFFASLMMLYISYGDGVVKFWEGCLMVMIYMLYVFWCWSGEKIIAYTRYAIFCQKEKGAGEHAGPPFHKLSESGTGTIATEQDSHHNILRVDSEEGISNLAVQSVPGKELELVDFAGRPETSEEEEEKDEEKAGEGASTLAVLKAEARVLLAVFYQTCVLREYFLRLPPDSANHPAALEHALA
uniref:Sodium/calcium exchanger membrane region domain-containing protein n=1 Tax=Heterosigma akashiwo TaxID=2829 RepID=A0A7S3YI58_HETAK